MKADSVATADWPMKATVPAAMPMKNEDRQGQSDDTLVRRLSDGDEQALAVLYERHRQPVFRFALQMTGDQSVAEEVSQEVFLSLISGSERFDASKGSLAGWLLGTARFQVYRILRRDRRYLSIDEEPDDERRSREPIEQLASPGSQLEDLTRRESVEALHQAILSLPVHYREVVALCDLNELTYEDAASALDCAVGTVRSRLHRARGLLVEKLKGGRAELSKGSWS